MLFQSLEISPDHFSSVSCPRKLALYAVVVLDKFKSQFDPERWRIPSRREQSLGESESHGSRGTRAIGSGASHGSWGSHRRSRCIGATSYSRSYYLHQVHFSEISWCPCPSWPRSPIPARPPAPNPSHPRRGGVSSSTSVSSVTPKGSVGSISGRWYWSPANSANSRGSWTNRSGSGPAEAEPPATLPFPRLGRAHSLRRVPSVPRPDHEDPVPDFSRTCVLPPRIALKRAERRGGIDTPTPEGCGILSSATTARRAWSDTVSLSVQWLAPPRSGKTSSIQECR